MHHDHLILLPVFNEGRHLPGMLRGLEPFRDNVLLLNDGSLDDSAAILARSGFRYLTLPENTGLGNVYRIGLEVARSMKVKKLILLDADGQHDPALIPLFISTLDDSPFAMGMRFADTSIVPRHKLASNLFACLVVRSLFGMSLPDVACGFRGFNLERLPAEIFDNGTKVEGFGFVYYMLFRLLGAGISPTYIPVDPAYGPNPEPGTKIPELRGLLEAARIFGELPLPDMLYQPEYIQFEYKFQYLEYGFILERIDQKLLRFGLYSGSAEAHFEQTRRVV